MFTKIFAGALIATAAYASNSDVVECTEIDVQTGTYWNISGLNKAGGYTYGSYKWNYCSDVDDGSYAVKTVGDKTVTLWDEKDYNNQEKLDKDGTVGLKLVAEGDLCKEVDEVKTYWSWTTTVWCDAEGETDKQVGNPVESDCNVSVEYSGPSGCPTFSLEDELAWFGENTWALGIVYLVIGVFVALFGLKMFPYVAATVTSLFSMIIIICLSVSFDTFNSTAGFWTTMTLALVAGILVGCFIRRKIWIATGSLGAIGGFFGGIVLLDIITAASGWTAVWAFWTFGIVCGVLGFLAAWKLGAPVINLATSFIGSYLFTRALTLFFWTEHWPSESEILNGAIDLDSLGWQFWFFVAIMGGCTFGSIVFQGKQEKSSELTEDDHYKNSM